MPAVSISQRSSPVNDVGSPYAWYVLFVLVIVYVFNFIDRQILSILAERIKADLQLGALGSLRNAMLCGLAANLVALIFGLLAARHLPHDESTKLARARAAGEPDLAA